MLSVFLLRTASISLMWTVLEFKDFIELWGCGKVTLFISFVLGLASVILGNIRMEEDLYAKSDHYQYLSVYKKSC